jgi:hypothetical protein
MATVVDDFTDPQLFEYGGLAESQMSEAEDGLSLPTEPQVDGVPFSQKSFGEKAQSLLANKERYKESAAQRSASLAWAALEQAAATDRQTSAIERQTAALVLQAEISNRMLAEQRKQNQLSFYAMTPADFEPKHAVEPEQVEGEPKRESVFMQIKRSLGIAPPLAPVAEVVGDDAEASDAAGADGAPLRDTSGDM